MFRSIWYYVRFVSVLLLLAVSFPLRVIRYVLAVFHGDRFAVLPVRRQHLMVLLAIEKNGSTADDIADNVWHVTSGELAPGFSTVHPILYQLAEDGRLNVDTTGGPPFRYSLSSKGEWYCRHLQLEISRSN